MAVREFLERLKEREFRIRKFLACTGLAKRSLGSEYGAGVFLEEFECPFLHSRMIHGAL